MFVLMLRGYSSIKTKLSTYIGQSADHCLLNVLLQDHLLQEYHCLFAQLRYILQFQYNKSAGLRMATTAQHYHTTL